MVILPGMNKVTNRKKLFAFLFGALFLMQLLPAQEPGVDGTGNGAFSIRSETYDIKGRTREGALKALLGPAEGASFPNAESLEGFARDRERKLEKLRLFKSSSVTVEWEDERTANLVVSVTDGAAVVPIPYAFYNSNDGLQAGTIVNVPNLAGTLQNLFLMGLYTAPPDENDALQWTKPNFLFISSLSGINAGPVTLQFAGTAMRMNRNVEYRGVTGVVTKVTALSGSVGVTRAITDSLSDTVSVRVAGSPASELVSVDDPELLVYGPIDLSVTVKNEATVDSYDWIGNFRDGWKLTAAAGWERSYPRYEGVQDSLTAEAEAAAYRAAGIFNPGLSVYGFAKWGNPELNLGMRTRGVRNGELTGNYGLFARSGVQTRVARFTSTEINVAPALDLFWLRERDSDRNYVGAAVGGELLFLIDSIKSLPIKLGFSWDCRPESQVIGGKRLEVDFNFSLSY